MKNYLILVFICSLPFFGFSQNLREPALIKTVGESIVYAAPNEVLLSFTVETIDTMVVKAKKNNTKISKKAIDFLRQQGVAEKHIQTQYATVFPLRNRHQASILGNNYKVSQRIEICIQKISSYEEIVKGLLERGIYTISGPTFRNTELKSYKDKARKKAIQAAKEKAKLLANELGQGVGRAYQINEIQVSFNRNNQSGYGTSEVEVDANEDNWSFAPGQMKVSAKIEVIFHLLNN